MKYIDADRLHAFLQKKLESYKSKMVDPLKFPIDHIDLMALLAREYQSLILQIDSLQQEQPEVDLEKEIRSMWEKCEPTDEGMGVESAYMHIEAFDIIARHFYELGLNARKIE